MTDSETPPDLNFEDWRTEVANLLDHHAEVNILDHTNYDFWLDWIHKQTPLWTVREVLRSLDFPEEHLP